MIRPLLLFLPSTILTFAIGFLYGAFWGVLYAQITILVSCSLAYIIGRYFGKGFKFEGKYSKLFESMRNHSFESTLLSRLIFLPGDLVNYGAGLLKVNYWGFLLGTFIGGIPGIVIVVLAGAAVKGSTTVDEIVIRKDYLLIASTILLLSLGLSWWLRARARRQF